MEAIIAHVERSRHASKFHKRKRSISSDDDTARSASASSNLPSSAAGTAIPESLRMRKLAVQHGDRKRQRRARREGMQRKTKRNKLSSIGSAALEAYHQAAEEPHADMSASTGQSVRRSERSADRDLLAQLACDSEASLGGTSHHSWGSVMRNAHLNDGALSVSSFSGGRERERREAQGGAPLSPALSVISHASRQSRRERHRPARPPQSARVSLMPGGSLDMAQDEADANASGAFEDGEQFGQFDSVEHAIQMRELADDGDWGEPSPDDSWCFLCHVGEEEDAVRDNQYYQDLVRIFANPEQMTRHSMCLAIQRKYMRDFYPFQLTKNKRIWTLRSIRNHAEHHGGMDETARSRDISSMLYHCMTVISSNMLRAYEPSTRSTWLVKGSVAMLVQLNNARLKVLSTL